MICWCVKLYIVVPRICFAILVNDALYISAQKHIVLREIVAWFAKQWGIADVVLSADAGLLFHFFIEGILLGLSMLDGIVFL